MDVLKVLFHVNENDKWPVALTNASNFLKDVGPGNAEVVVVANGAAVSAYADAAGGLVERMNELAAAGVLFEACRNALGMQDIAEDTLPPFVSVVSAGITEIARRQARGYAYIKP